MEQHPAKHGEAPTGAARGRNRDKIVVVAFLAIAGFYLYTEHRAHLYGALPWLLIALCPFLHFFLHRGEHGRHTAGKPGERP